MICPKCHFKNPTNTFICSKCASPLHSSTEIPSSSTKTLPIRELSRGNTFAGRYDVIEELGKGGMGRVYKVLDKEIKEKVALKLLKPEIASDRKTIVRFRNELKMARRISHKNVCRMYHFSKDKSTHYITMEYVSGEDLKSLIRRIGQFTIGKSIFIAKQVCEGLAEAHRLGVIHRDLKPRNIMIDSEGNARIMDFGIARSLKTKGITGVGVIIGTPEYMAPEQVEGKETDERSDIYSLGIILFEMVTGKVPFEGDSPLSIAVKQKTEGPPNPKEINSQIPEDLTCLILKCMEKDKRKRYQSSESLLSELSKIEKGIPITDRIIPKKKFLTSKKITAYLSQKKLFIPALVLIAFGMIVTFIWRPFPQSEFSIPPKIENYFSDGNKYWKEKKYLEAINKFKEILAIEPKNLEAQLSLATILKEQGKIEEAIQEYERVIAINNSDHRPYDHLGEIYEQKQELKKAMDYYRKYLNNTPKKSKFNRFNQKIKELEHKLQFTDEQNKDYKIKQSDIIPSKTDKSRSKPLEIEKEKVDLTSKTDLGIKAFNQEDFDECIKQMQEILKLDSNNNTAHYYFAEAKKKKKEIQIKQEIRNRLRIAQNTYQKENYQECINQTKKVLRLDPNNSQAKKYLNLANQKIAPKQINAVINQYIQSINNENLVAFYKNACSPQLYRKIKKDVELTYKLYDDLQSVASNISIRFKGINRAEISFSHIITGISRKEGATQMLFEGVFKWDMEKKGDHWKIVDMSSRLIENRIRFI